MRYRGCGWRRPTRAAGREARGQKPDQARRRQEVVPSLEEAGLLADALAQLDEPFLVVVVGEVNSGKGTVRASDWDFRSRVRGEPF